MSTVLETTRPAVPAASAPAPEVEAAGAERVFGLFAVSPLAPEARRSSVRRGAKREALWVPLRAEGVSRVAIEPGGTPRVLAGAEEAAGGHLALEPACQKRLCFLVMRRVSALAVRVNGAPASRMTVLRAGDQLDAGDASLLVSLWVRPYLGPALAEHAGLVCPVCLTSFPSGKPGACYQCPWCMVLMHYHGDEVAAEDRLECGKVSDCCPRCGAPVVKSGKGEFSHVPD